MPFAGPCREVRDVPLASFDLSYRDGVLADVFVHPDPDVSPNVRYIEPDGSAPFCVLEIQGFKLFLTVRQGVQLAERLTVELAHLAGRQEVAAR